MSSWNKGVLLIFIGVALSKLSGYVRELVYAYEFGASSHMDSYLVAFLIPSLIANIVAATVPPIVMPEYLKQLQGNGANKMISLFITYLFVVIFALILIVLLFSEPISFWLASGFEAAALQQTAVLIQLLAPYAICSCAMIMINTILQANKKVFFSSFLQVPTNIVTVILVILYADRMGIYAIALALYLSFFIQVALLLFSLKKVKFHFRIKFTADKEEYVYLWKLAYPPLLSSLLYYCYAITERHLASQYAEGSVSYLAFAYKAVELPMSIILLIITALLYPKLTRLFVGNEFTSFNEQFIASIRIIIYSMLPLAITCFVLNKEIIYLLYYRGAFDLHDVDAASSVLVIYAFIMIPMLMKDLLNYSFYARKNLITPLLFTLLEVASYILLSYTFYRLFNDFRWLAVALTLAITLQAFGLSMKSLSKFEITIKSKQVWNETMKIIGIAALVTTAAKFSYTLLLNELSSFSLLLVVTFIITVTYLLLLRMFQVKLPLHKLRKNSS